MIKKVVICLLLIIVSFAFIACSNENVQDNNTNHNQNADSMEDSDPIKLSAPVLTTDSKNNIYWEVVENCNGYIVNVDGQDREPSSLTFFSYIMVEGNHTVKVKAISNSTSYQDSDYSIAIEYYSKKSWCINKNDCMAYSIVGDDYVVDGDNYSFAVNVSFMYKGDYIVKVNNIEIQAVNELYTVNQVTADVNIEVTGLVAKTMNVKINDVLADRFSMDNISFEGDSSISFEDGVYSFSIIPDDNFTAKVLYNDEVLSPIENEYTISDFIGVTTQDESDLNIYVSVYQIGFSSLTGDISYNVVQTNTLAPSVKGTKLYGSTNDIFNYDEELSFISGNNTVIKFHTTNSYEGYEVKYFGVYLMDTVTNNKLTIYFYSSHWFSNTMWGNSGAASSSAIITIDYNGTEIVREKIMSYKDNFDNSREYNGSNENCGKGSGKFYLVPELTFDTTTGILKYCNELLIETTDLIGFGTNSISTYIKLGEVKIGNGIVVENFCNKNMSSLKDGVICSGTSTSNFVQENCNTDSITGLKLTGKNRDSFVFKDSYSLSNGNNTLIEFLTTNTENGYQVESFDLILKDKTSGKVLTLCLMSAKYIYAAYGWDANYNKADMYMHVMIDGLDKINSVCSGKFDNFSNSCRGDNEYNQIPKVTLDTTTGKISICGTVVYTDSSLIGFGGHGVDVEILFTSLQEGYGIVINTLCNKEI